MLPEPVTLLAAAVGAAVGGAVLLLVIGLRGTVHDPTAPPGRAARWLAALRQPAVGARALAGIAVAVVVLVLTGWPMAAVGMGLLAVTWPLLFGGSRAEQHAITRLEALVGWTEQMHDTITGHVGLEQAIATTAAQAAPEIREPMERLLGRLRANLPLEQVLLDLARDVDDPESADRIIAALILNVKNRGTGLAGVLRQLTATGRETLALRRKAAAKRAAERRACRLMVAVTLGLATFLVVFAPIFIHPYRGVVGQLMLAVVVGLFAAAFAVMRKLSTPTRVLPFLPRSGGPLTRRDYQVIAALTATPTSGPAAVESQA
jgi:Flp pilus assembly protein TadB